MAVYKNPSSVVLELRLNGINLCGDVQVMSVLSCVLSEHPKSPKYLLTQTFQPQKLCQQLEK